MMFGNVAPAPLRRTCPASGAGRAATRPRTAARMNFRITRDSLEIGLPRELQLARRLRRARGVLIEVEIDAGAQLDAVGEVQVQDWRDQDTLVVARAGVGVGVVEPHGGLDDLDESRVRA